MPGDRQGEVFFRLDQQDREFSEFRDEVKEDMKSIKKMVYELRMHYRMLLATGTVLMLLGTIIAWLLEQHYLVVQIPH